MTDAPSSQSRSQAPTRVAPFTAAELAQVSIDLQTLVGAQLQECLQTESEVGLGIYHEREMVWLWFDLHPQRPLILRFDGKPPARKKLMRPLTLFLRSHFLGRRLESVRADLARGRILVFSFHRGSNEDETGPCEIEVRLFPHGQNVIARNGRKSIAESRPKDLPSVGADFVTDAPQRSWAEIQSQWQALQSGKPSGVKAAVNDAAQIEKEWKKTLEKKEKALVRMREELEQKTMSVYSEIGEWLKANGTLEVPKEWMTYIDASKSLAWNIEELFHRSKENTRKLNSKRSRR